MDDKQEDLNRASLVSWIGSVWKGLVPIGVAAATALAIGSGVDFAHSYGDPRKKEHSAKPAAEPDRDRPRYVVGVRGSGEALVVRDVTTGRDVGLPVAAPREQRFQRLAPVDDGSFVVAVASDDGGVTFQRLRLGKNGHPQKLAPVNGAAVPGTSAPWSDLAVAPDGDTIAFVTYGSGARARLEVVSARTGERKSWTSGARGRVGSLSWAGSRLSFVWSPSRKVDGTTVHQVRSLATATAAPGNLQASKLVLKLPAGSGGTAVMSRDGRTVVVGLGRDGQLALQAYTLPAGRLAQVLWKRKAPGQVSRLDSDHTGTHLLVSTSDGTLFPEDAKALSAKDLLDTAW